MSLHPVGHIYIHMNQTFYLDHNLLQVLDVDVVVEDNVEDVEDIEDVDMGTDIVEEELQQVQI